MAENPVWSVTADRVNVRAKPDLYAEVIAQVGLGDRVEVIEASTNWVEIMAPDNVALWLHRDFIRDGVVQARKLNVRSGPGVNYTVMGTLHRGDPVQELEAFGDWIRIPAWTGITAWVARTFVEPTPVPPLAEVTAFKGEVADALPPPPGPLPVPMPVPPPAETSKPEPPEDWPLIPLEGQGRVVQREGVLRPAGFFTTYPTRYRLVGLPPGPRDPICFVYGSEEVLGERVGRRMLVKGREYWVQDADYPVLVPEQIFLRAHTEH